MGLKIGFVCGEYFHSNEVNGKIIPSNAHGGFGFLTRIKAEYLANHGHEVHVFIPGESFVNNTTETKRINNVQVHTYKTNYDRVTLLGKTIRELKGLTRHKDLNQYFNEIELDLLQSEDTPPSDILMDKSIKIPFLMIYQDPWDYYDINLLIDSENNYLNILKSKVLGYELKTRNYRFKNSFLINAAHKKNYIRPIKKFLGSNYELIYNYAEAKFIAKKSETMFDLSKTPEILLNPIKMYNIKREKFDTPTICWVARWDPQKRPDMAILIASEMPSVNFIMIGTATMNSKNYKNVEKYLHNRFTKLKNLKILGFVSEENKREVIGKSWGLLNTSIREGLPITFLEAMAEGTPIISFVDPDEYASRFGIKVEDYNINSFRMSIERVISELSNREIGDKARKYIMSEHELEVVMKKQIRIYEEVLKR